MIVDKPRSSNGFSSARKSAVSADVSVCATARDEESWRLSSACIDIRKFPVSLMLKFRVSSNSTPSSSYSAVCPELPGCTSEGDTEDEARINIEEAIKLYLQPDEIELPENAKLIEVTIGERGTPRLIPDQVIRVLKRHGFVLAGQTGSHQKWRNAANRKRVVLAYHRHKIVSLGTMTIIDESGIALVD